MNGISTTQSVEHRIVRVSRSHRKGVTTAAQRNIQGFNRSVRDASRHSQSSQGCPRQVTRVATGVRRVIYIHRVAAILAIDRQ